MNFTSPPSNLPSFNGFKAEATLSRLIGNLSGFIYRRRNDNRWTMEFVSDGCRDLTGYDPHRFIGNASIAFGELIARTDWQRVNDRVRVAAQRRQRTTIEYLIRTAHGAWVQVEDRLTPIVNSAGQVLAIEGIIDRARCHHAMSWTPIPEFDESRLAGLCLSPSSN
jgi:PAS domain S-box-containing protein